jgi:hypothetical protein
MLSHPRSTLARFGATTLLGLSVLVFAPGTNFAAPPIQARPMAQGADGRGVSLQGRADRLRNDANQHRTLGRHHKADRLLVKAAKLEQAAKRPGKAERTAQHRAKQTGTKSGETTALVPYNQNTALVPYNRTTALVPYNRTTALVSTRRPSTEVDRQRDVLSEKARVAQMKADHFRNRNPAQYDRYRKEAAGYRTQASQLGRTTAAAAERAADRHAPARSTSERYVMHKDRWQTHLVIAKKQQVEGTAKNDPALLRKAAINRATAARHFVKMLKIQRAGALAKGDQARADKLGDRVKKITKALEVYEAKIPALKDVAKITAAAEHMADGAAAAAATATATERARPKAKAAGDARVAQAADDESPGFERRGETPAVAAAEPAAREAASAPSMSMKDAKRNFNYSVKNRNLDGALAMLQVMEKEASQRSGVGGWWARRTVSGTRAKLRRAAVVAGKASIRDGSAAESVNSRLGKEERRELGRQAREVHNEIKGKVESGEWTKEQGEQEWAQVKARVRELLSKSSPSNYDSARSALTHLEKTALSYKGKPVQRLLAGLATVLHLRGTPQRAQRKLDRALLKQVRYLGTKRALKELGVDAVLQAKLLLDAAKTRGLDQKMRLRHWYARRKAFKNINRSIKRGVSEGNPDAVYQSYMLKHSMLSGGSKLHQADGYQLPEKETEKFNHDMASAKITMVDKLARQAEWILKYPRAATQDQFDTSTAAKILTIARTMADQLPNQGIYAKNSTLNRLNRVEKQLNARAPGLFKKVFINFPLAVVKAPFKIVKYLTVNQVRFLLYHKQGGAPKEPLDRARLIQILEQNRPEYAQQMGATDGSGAPMPGGPPRDLAAAAAAYR